MSSGGTKIVAEALAWLVPNFAAFNVISQVAHAEAVAGRLILYNTVYAILYAAVCLSASVLIFERRDLK
jgi:ABC-type transport system involved in multi-copper enzyme maturation permease subunit